MKYGCVWHIFGLLSPLKVYSEKKSTFNCCITITIYCFINIMAFPIDARGN